jgi:cytochrome P450
MNLSQIVQAFRALFGDRLKMIERISSNVERIERVQLGPRRFVVVKDPELIAAVLVEGVDKYVKGPVLRIIARPLLGDGLLTSEGEAHRNRRKLVAPSFAHQRVSKYAAVMTEQTLAIQSQWREGQSVNMAQEMMRLTLGIVGRTLFDVDLLDQADSLGEDITTVQESADVRMRFMPIQLPYRKKERLALERLNATMFGMIAERRKTGKDHGDLMSMLMLSKDEETGEHLNDQQVRDESMTLFLAGHETTAQAMAWAWYLLSKNPQYWDRLRNDGPAFALQVMKETMRLYPPAFLLARTPIRETEIDGFKVTPEDVVLIAPWLMHRDARFFEDPLRFDPDRFLPEREAKIPKFAYMPFGGGRRICIGNQFALMEGQIILHTIGQHIRSMELLSDKPIELEPYITLRPKGGVHLRLHRSAVPAASGAAEHLQPTSRA